MKEIINKGNIFFEGDNVISLKSVSQKEDLSPKKGKFNINPPPADGFCECCERSFDDLKPFPNGDLLMKRYRAYIAPDEEIDRIMEEYSRNCKTKADYDEMMKKMIKIFGEERAKEINFLHEASHLISSSWECQDCCQLDGHEYDKMVRETQSKFWEEK